MNLVLFVIVGAGCAAIPLLYDMLRSFLPPGLRGARLVAVWHRQALLALVCSLCAAAYYLFWCSVLPYSHPLASRAGLAHVALATWLWVMTVWNFAMTAAVDPGAAEPLAATEPDEAGGGKRWPAGSHACAVCGVRILQFDHHCPFTGGCVGLQNFRFFFLFAIYGWLGTAYAAWLAWWPFRDCVLSQLTLPALGWARRAPPDEAACVSLAGRSLLLLPAATVCAALGCLAALHAVLVANGVTTRQLARRLRTRGAAYLADLARGRAAPDADKLALLLGRERRHARRLLLPSLPDDPQWRLSPGIASPRLWVGALLSLAAMVGALGLASQALALVVRVGGPPRPPAPPRST